MAAASRRSLSQLLQQGWNEIPDIIASSGMAVVGLGMGILGCYNYVKNDGDNRRYKKTFVIMRSDDPKVQKIRRE